MPTALDPGHPARKRRHIEVCLTEQVEYTTRSTGFERYDLPYNAVPDTSLTALDTATSLFDRPMSAPVLIGAMTGGAELSAQINANLAIAGQRLGLGMMLGSQRVMLHRPETVRTFAVRDQAPDILLIGNLGLAQLRRDRHPDEIARLVDAVGADALAIHANPLQESVQHGGDTDFADLSERLRALTAAVRFPVLLKEVGHGISGEVAHRVADFGLAAIDVAGAGGTSWSRVEQYVRHGRIVHPDLAEWGIPTAHALQQVRAAVPELAVIASGGIRTGVDAAKALALGADAVAVARPLLAPALESADAVTDWLSNFLTELRIAMHCTGCSSLAELRKVGVIARA